jgi:DNA-binding beta-propeller fold protein YncE
MAPAEPVQFVVEEMRLTHVIADVLKDAATLCAVAGVLLVILAIAPVEKAGQREPPDFRVKKLRLPGATGLVTLDYFAYDEQNARLWVPAGNLGVVAVIDEDTDKITSVGGFQTREVVLPDRKRVMGPSSVSIGDGVVYIGNRADSSICVINSATLNLAGCSPIADPSAGLASAPDAVVYVSTTKELWVTTGAPPLGVPAADQSLLILDASNPKHLKQKMRLALGASAEGYAVDEKHGLFYTSLEEHGETVAIDLRRKQIVSRWHSGCDEPHGVALDKERRFLFVACAGRVIALDAAHEGKVLGSILTGDGLDNIDYSQSQKTVYAAASVAGTLTIASVDDRGGMTAVALIPTAKGARSVIAGNRSTAYLIDPFSASILKVATSVFGRHHPAANK